MAALLKDIMCFTNTVHDRDCYIVFGVNDALEIVGMKALRRRQADIIDALDKLSFASVHTPQIAVETIIIKSTDIDVLIIYNTGQTSVYLKSHMVRCWQDASIPTTKTETPPTTEMRK
jgi:hypothetical protein